MHHRINGKYGGYELLDGPFIRSLQSSAQTSAQTESTDRPNLLLCIGIDANIYYVSHSTIYIIFMQQETPTTAEENGVYLIVSKMQCNDVLLHCTHICHKEQYIKRNNNNTFDAYASPSSSPSPPSLFHHSMAEWNESNHNNNNFISSRGLRFLQWLQLCMYVPLRMLNYIC